MEQSHRLPKKTPSRFSTVLTNTKKQLDFSTSREDNIAFCSKGEAVTVQYNGPAMRYFVYNSQGKEIGELGVPAFDTLIERRISKTDATITAIDNHRSGSLKVRISINLLPE